MSRLFYGGRIVLKKNGAGTSEHPLKRMKLDSSNSTQFKGFPGGSVVKNLPANAGDVGSIPGPGRFPHA